MTIERVTKLEAARRQLTVAVDLFFREDDELAVRTLASAAYNILRDLNRHAQGSPMLLKEQLPSVVPQPLSSKLVTQIQLPENFLKHADRDPAESLDLHVGAGQVELILFDAALKYRELSGQLPTELALSVIWFLCHAQVDSDDPHALRWITALRHAGAGLGRTAFRRRMWEEARRMSGDSPPP